MSTFLQLIATGAVIGGIYALFAVGFALAFGVVGALNLAYAQMFVWGALGGIFVPAVLGLTDIGTALVAGGVVGAVLGLLIEQVGFRTLRMRGYHSELAAFIGSLGLFLILQTVANDLTQGRTFRYPNNIFTSAAVEFGGIRVTALELFAVGVAVVVMVVLHLVLRRTRIGTAVRAVAANRSTSELLGINSERVFGLTSIVVGLCAGIAGVLIGIVTNQVSTALGDVYLLKAMLIVVVGGLGSIPGAVAAAIAIGLIETTSSNYIGSQWQDVVLFGVLLAVLLVRPHGLAGTGERLRT